MPLSAWNRQSVRPLPSTRIVPSLELLATATVAAAVGVAGAGEEPVELVALGLPQAAAARSAARKIALLMTDADTGESYSGVTYAAVIPPSTTNVAPLT